MSKWAAVRIGARGLRQSWDSVDKNTFLRSSASRREASTRLNSVMSCTTDTEPMMLPPHHARVSRAPAGGAAYRSAE